MDRLQQLLPVGRDIVLGFGDPASIGCRMVRRGHAAVAGAGRKGWDLLAVDEWRVEDAAHAAQIGCGTLELLEPVLRSAPLEPHNERA
jgi:hypothetical protein